jgi:uncharacterized protein with von Willebrand factor type A (vWA) domain
MTEFQYSRYDGSQAFTPQSADALFDQLSNYLLEYGDEALALLDRLQEEHPEVLSLLLARGHVERDAEGRFQVTPRGVRRVEARALEELFEISRRDKSGKHETMFRGAGQMQHDEFRGYEFGDPITHLNVPETLKNALSRRVGLPVEIHPEDFVVFDTQYQSACATVVLVDMSGSMARMGKFAMAKKVALALSALVRSRYAGDELRIVGFYTSASALTERELLLAAPKEVSLFDSRVNLRIPIDRPPRFVPQHFTNIHAGLQFARRILHRLPAANKQIITITDGEPTAHVEGRELVLVYPPAERTARMTLAEARRCSQEGIHLASFALVEDYFYLGLVNFVEQMAAVTGGVAAYCSAQDLGNLVIESFTSGRRKRRALG